MRSAYDSLYDRGKDSADSDDEIGVFIKSLTFMFAKYSFWERVEWSVRGLSTSWHHALPQWMSK